MLFQSMIDLHTHSTASDGILSPSALMEYAHSKNITTIALSDHDTLKGLAEAEKKANELGINFIPACEFSIEWPTGEFHLLGYGLDTPSQSLLDVLTYIHNRRMECSEQTAQKLRDQGFDISLEEVCREFNTRSPGRPHFADLLVKKGYFKERQTVFDRYLAKGRKCYVPRHGADLKQTVNAIKESCGIPVIAHPMSLYVSWGKLEGVMTSIKDAGVMGLEAWHPAIRYSQAQRLEKLAEKLGMFVTAGSDFHGEKVRKDRHIGYTAGKIKIDDRFYNNELYPALQKAGFSTI